jgi:regulator of nucleoside diphosphate kinase
MKEHTIYITKADAKKLRDLIQNSIPSGQRRNIYFQMLSAELNRAMIVASEQIPADVITMNSQACLVDLETGEEMTYTLVFPEDADAQQGKISILAPIGTGMLGFRAGDIFEWETPDGVRKIRVEKVIFQPEANGDYC